MDKFTREILRSLEPGDALDRWLWRAFMAAVILLTLMELFG